MIDPDTAWTLFFFGLWTILITMLGIGAGAWLTHRKQSYQSPMPDSVEALGEMTRQVFGGDPQSQIGQGPDQKIEVEHHDEYFPHKKL